MNRQKSLIAVFLLAAGILLFWNLGRVPLFDPDEGRYSDIAQTMILTGDYMTPRMDYVSHYHKPPLSNWFVVSAFKAFGFSEFSARFPSVVLSLLLMTLMIFLGKFLFDFRTGLYASCILLTSALYMATSRLVTTDMALVFFTFAAMFSIARLFFSEKHKIFFFYTAILALAFGMLTKGPVAWMITLVPALVFGIVRKRGISIPWQHWLIGFVLFWAVSLSWYAAVILQNQGAFDYFIHYQLAGRIIKGTAGRKHPFFYYFLVLPLGFLPWTVFMPAVFKWNLKSPREREARDRIYFVLIWFLVPFILFSIFKTKLATYIVPLFPPLALFAACFWKDWDENKVPADKGIVISGWILSVAYIVMAVGGVVFVLIKPEFVSGIHPGAVAAAAALLIAASIFSIRILRSGKSSWIFKSQAGIMFMAMLIALTALPSIQYKNTKAFAAKILELQKPGDKVIMWRNYYASLPFYLKERVITMGVDMETKFEPEANYKDYVFEDFGRIHDFFEGPDRVFVMTNEKMFSKFPEFSKAPVYILMRRQKLVLFSNKP